MPAIAPNSQVKPFSTHPMCPVCAVPLWLVKIMHHVSGDPKLTRKQFECKVCDAVAILPPMDD